MAIRTPKDRGAETLAQAKAAQGRVPDEEVSFRIGFCLFHDAFGELGHGQGTSYLEAYRKQPEAKSVANHPNAAFDATRNKWLLCGDFQGLATLGEIERKVRPGHF